jgi:hypothetical protein
MKKLVLAFGILFFLFSCEKNDDVIYPENINDQDLMLKSGKPAQPGNNLKVFRFDVKGIAYELYDENTNLTAWIGVDIRQYLKERTLASWDLITIQQILKKDGDGLHLMVNQDDITVEVWEGNIGNDYWKLFAADPIYSGTGHVVFTQNENLSPSSEDNYFRVWGLRLNGDGINVRYHVTWHGNDPSTIEPRYSILLK